MIVALDAWNELAVLQHAPWLGRLLAASILRQAGLASEDTRTSSVLQNAAAASVRQLAQIQKIANREVRMQYLFNSRGQHIANFVNGQFHAPTGANIGHFRERQGIFIDMTGRSGFRG